MAGSIPFSISPQDLYAAGGTASGPLVIDVRRRAGFDTGVRKRSFSCWPSAILSDGASFDDSKNSQRRVARFNNAKASQCRRLLRLVGDLSVSG